MCNLIYYILEPFVPGMIRKSRQLNKNSSLSASSKNINPLTRSEESNYTRAVRKHGTTAKMML